MKYSLSNEKNKNQLTERSDNRHFGYLDDIFNNFFNEISELTYPFISVKSKPLFPKMDIAESNTDYTLEAEIPGVKESDIDIKINNDVLTIEGKKESTSEKTDKNYHMQERYYGSFYRSIKLPTNIKEEEVSATYKDGILTVKIPKKEQSKTKKIEVKKES